MLSGGLECGKIKLTKIVFQFSIPGFFQDPERDKIQYFKVHCRETKMQKQNLIKTNNWIRKFCAL